MSKQDEPIGLAQAAEEFGIARRTLSKAAADGLLKNSPASATAGGPMEKKCIGPCQRILDIRCFGSKGKGRKQHFCDVSRLTRFTKKKLLAEIAKCDVVCSNCHRERTHQRRQRKS